MRLSQYIHDAQFMPRAASYNLADRGLQTRAPYSHMRLAFILSRHHENCVLNVRLKVNKQARGQMKEQAH